MNARHLLKISLFNLLLGFLLIGCGTKTISPISVEPDNVPYKIEGACDKTLAALEKKLRDNGIKLMTMGQNYLISIPSLLLFPEQSPALRWESYAILNDVACYMRQYRKIAVNVNTYTNHCLISPRHERALTLARSRAVGDYLWSQGIDSRFIFTVGHGSDKPIVGFIKGKENSPNSRVEITFRRAIA